VNLTLDNEQDPLSLQHVRQSKYWNEWLTTMHEELEAQKVKDVYEEVDDLMHGRKAVQCKWVLHIK
jgi:formate dehydrogenase maturation protein FdhE